MIGLSSERLNGRVTEINPVNAQRNRETIKALPVAEYASDLAMNGRRVLPGSYGTFWVQYNNFAMMRMPLFHVEPPSIGEIRRALWRGPAAVASFVREPSERYPANAWLYVCTDQEYALEKLTPAMRRNVRRGLKELKLGPVTATELLDYGANAVRDSYRRFGLKDEPVEEFRRQISLRAKCRGHVFFGAWKGDDLAAYLSIAEVDDWVEVTSCFSADRFRPMRPNDALLFYILSHYLKERAFRTVNFGVSSIQTNSSRVGLHRFKTKVGFEAVPVHRAFVLHPLLRPIANRATLWGVNTALRFAPGNRRLKNAESVLATILKVKLPVIEDNTPD